jgi:Cytochrome C assembly protein.
MSWDSFVWFALGAVLFWAAGAFFAWKGRKAWVYACTLTGIAVFFAFILGMWISLERPPLQTMGETRLWYSFFLPVAGIIVYGRWRYKWILTFSTLLSFVFICVNLFKPDIHSKSLMPALQSPWFAPHVIVYMFSYALLGAATVMAVYMLIKKGTTEKEINLTDNLVYVGLAFLTFGMLSVPFGQRRPGVHTGPGIPRKPGPPPPGSAIWCTCTCARRGPATGKAPACSFW